MTRVWRSNGPFRRLMRSRYPARVCSPGGPQLGPHGSVLRGPSPRSRLRRRQWLTSGFATTRPFVLAAPRPSRGARVPRTCSNNACAAGWASSKRTRETGCRHHRGWRQAESSPVNSMKRWLLSSKQLGTRQHGRYGNPKHTPSRKSSQLC